MGHIGENPEDAFFIFNVIYNLLVPALQGNDQGQKKKSYLSHPNVHKQRLKCKLSYTQFCTEFYFCQHSGRKGSSVPSSVLPKLFNIRFL